MEQLKREYSLAASGITSAPFSQGTHLSAHLEWSSQGLQYDRLVDQYRPSKAETATRLDALTEALGLVQRELDDTSIRNLLEDAKYIKHLSGSSGMVRDLAPLKGRSYASCVS